MHIPCTGTRKFGLRRQGKVTIPNSFLESYYYRKTSESEAQTWYQFIPSPPYLYLPSWAFSACGIAKHGNSRQVPCSYAIGSRGKARHGIDRARFKLLGIGVFKYVTCLMPVIEIPLWNTIPKIKTTKKYRSCKFN